MDITTIQEIYKFFKGVLLPAIVGVCIKILIDLKNGSFTYTRAFISFGTGIGFAWLLSPLVLTNTPESWQPMIIGTIAITGEKIGEYLIHRFQVDTWIEIPFIALKNFLKTILNADK